ncbi:hypothetical protein, partial [Acetobacter senegalensis]|uniref:hypothetical protein n=1 Tax=Acetobacter senegalensis TaxID=446692 RepID=UPI002ED2AF61
MIREDDHGIPDAIAIAQGGFNLAGFDAEAAQLDLLVETSKKLNGAIWLLTAKIASAIQTSTGDGGIGNKPLRRQPRLLQITTGQCHTANAQFPNTTTRNSGA